MSNGVDDIEGCLDFCADDFEFFGVLDALDEALMCFCYNSEAEYEQYGESDICSLDERRRRGYRRLPRLLRRRFRVFRCARCA